MHSRVLKLSSLRLLSILAAAVALCTSAPSARHDRHSPWARSFRRVKGAVKTDAAESTGRADRSARAVRNDASLAATKLTVRQRPCQKSPAHLVAGIGCLYYAAEWRAVRALR